MKARIWLEVELPDEQGEAINATVLSSVVQLASTELQSMGAITVAAAMQLLTDDPDSTRDGTDVPRLEPQ